MITIHVYLNCYWSNICPCRLTWMMPHRLTENKKDWRFRYPIIFYIIQIKPFDVVNPYIYIKLVKKHIDRAQSVRSICYFARSICYFMRSIYLCIVCNLKTTFVILLFTCRLIYMYIDRVFFIHVTFTFLKRFH